MALGSLNTTKGWQELMAEDFLQVQAAGRELEVA